MRGSYRETAAIAILGRAAFVVLLIALLYGAFFHSTHLFASTHVAHFAGFYIFSMACAATAKRRSVISLGAYIAALAVVIEAIRALIWLPLASTYLDAVGDLAGVVGALAPMLLQKVRSDFANDVGVDGGARWPWRAGIDR